MDGQYEASSSFVADRLAMTVLIVLSLMSVASIVLCIKCARFACRRFFRRTTTECWLGKVQTTMSVFAAALSIGLYLGLRGHPPIALGLVLTTYALGLWLLGAAVVVEAARSGLKISIQAIVGVGVVVLAATVLVTVNLATGYVIAGLGSSTQTIP